MWAFFFFTSLLSSIYFMYLRRFIIRHQSGFTILELLVVIAIISIIASVIIVALNASRGKGKDAGIKVQLVEARNQAQLYFENHNGRYCGSVITPPECDAGALYTGAAGACSAYNTIFWDDLSSNPGSIYPHLMAANAQAPSGSDPQCYMDLYGLKWASVIKLNDIESGWWCIDSSGNSKVMTGAAQDIKDAVGPIITCP